MKSNYKRLGDYIRQVDVRNRDLAVTELIGLTIDKTFIPSVANTIGTDLSNYKVISHNQFACSLMQVSRDEKMPVAIYKGDKAIMSPAYPMFEVCRTDELLPEFLMMWFSRKEFDREVTFWAVGGVRGSLTWEDFINLHIPVPPIEEQRKIVAEYQAVERRIENNRHLIATLEATAQTIYRKMFVDNIDPENLPEGWRVGIVGDLFTLQRGHDLPSQNRMYGEIPIYASTGINGYHNEYRVKAPCVVTGRSGSIGVVNYVTSDFWPLNTTLFVKDCEKSSMEYAFFKLKELELEKLVAGFAAVPTLNRNDVHMIKCIVAPKNYINEFSIRIKPMFTSVNVINKEIIILEQTLLLILSRLSTYK